MREVKRSALVGRPPAALFALINDIESYPQFLPWCTHARVESRSPHEIVATLGVSQGALQGEFTTRNTLEPDRSILMQLLSGPFRTLEGEWRLTPVDGDGCCVERSEEHTSELQSQSNLVCRLLLEKKKKKKKQDILKHKE